MDDSYLALYDVRGIQNYIYRTAKLADVIGASVLVENIILEALKYSIAVLDTSLDYCLDWYDSKDVFEYKDMNQYDIEVLFIGGGNAYVLFKTKDTMREINKIMSRYIREKTYSLELVCAFVKKSEHYSKDYVSLIQQLNEVKAQITNVKPIGALPIMEVEIMTGYPIINQRQESTETVSKRKAKPEEDETKILDNLVTQKGEDSLLAIVHIDGNNMGQRIVRLIADIEDYGTAINTMRRLSYNINKYYQYAFNQTKEYFDAKRSKEGKKTIRPIIVAGDDITYICNDLYALDSVEYFCQLIANHAINEQPGQAPDLEQYGFSVCAGVAFVGSHFPFSVGYNVAESLVKSAKEFAKKKENKDGERIGNYVDYQIVKNIHCSDLKTTRLREYVTPLGENLINRPYYIKVESDTEKLKSMDQTIHSYRQLRSNVEYFANTEHIPKSFVKEIRNTYSLGSHYMRELVAFLESRQYQMPEQKDHMEMYDQNKNALYYDAIELVDLFALAKKGSD